VEAFTNALPPGAGRPIGVSDTVAQELLEQADTATVTPRLLWMRAATMCSPGSSQDSKTKTPATTKQLSPTISKIFLRGSPFTNSF